MLPARLSESIRQAVPAARAVPYFVTAWDQDGIEHRVITPKGVGSVVDTWTLPHLRAVESLKAQFPPPR